MQSLNLRSLTRNIIQFHQGKITEDRKRAGLSNNVEIRLAGKEVPVSDPIMYAINIMTTLNWSYLL